MKRTFAFAAVFLVLYFAMLPFLGQVRPGESETYWKRNRTRIAEYPGGHQPSVVVAGSSLTAALDFGRDRECVYNFGLIGESGLTGMDVILNSDHVPSVIFVEINFAVRDINQRLVHEASGSLNGLLPDWSFPAPIELAGDWLSRMRASSSSIARANTSNNASPQEKIDPRAREIALNAENLKTLFPENLLAAKMLEYQDVFQSAARKGAKVVLFELPVYHELQQSEQLSQVRKAFLRTFPDLPFISAGQLSEGLNVQTVDGLHLSSNDMPGVVHRFRRFYATDCK